ncbi:hypothetical protein AQUCO_02600369v1 [Aquilegia coerulea]|uniref:FAS1 domain-containing protein n=1 Tax=Aquilegia coerulea TaxID=218851 RepID=A0A2G5D8Q1_AQUCA|nr:hypothetical protein AQUCO_02600369v1 [Aquilegia coerulea]
MVAVAVFLGIGMSIERVLDDFLTTLVDFLTILFARTKLSRELDDVAVVSLFGSSSWNGYLTIFAPTDNLIRSCGGASCSVLQQHIVTVPGIFSPDDYLNKLAFRKKLETMSTGTCMTVTSGSSRDKNDTIVYIGGVEITQHDFFYNGLVVVHRLEGFISFLSPFSFLCEIQRMTMTPLSFPSPQSENRTNARSINTTPSSAIMCLMLKDATVEFGGIGGSGTGTLYDSAAAVGDPAIFKTRGFADNLGMGSCAAFDKGCVVEAAPAPKRHKEIL